MALPDYLQDTGKDLARQMTASYSAPLDTSTFMGSQFVAGQDPAQTAAYGLATQGVGSYQPYLTAAQTAAGQAATTVGGLGAFNRTNDWSTISRLHISISRSSYR